MDLAISDLDGNNTIDMVSMLVVAKQGVLGIIGDPLIPASTTESTPVGGGGGGATENPSTD